MRSDSAASRSLPPTAALLAGIYPPVMGRSSGFRSLGGLNRELIADRQATETSGRVVPGEGPVGAAIALVGEQPGEGEDREGRPFVGPAGQLLDSTLQAAGISRADCYLTNAVKQFHFVRRGKKRLHQKPHTAEVVHYRWWLDRELAYVQPRVIVALGATAAFALAQRRVSVTANRGPFDFAGRVGFITFHPSSILRIPEREARHAALAEFLSDLKRVRRLARESNVERRAASATSQERVHVVRGGARRPRHQATFPAAK